MLNSKPTQRGNYQQGLYTPQNKNKVVKLNNEGGLYFRSSWEKRIMIWLDYLAGTGKVARWGAEFIEIKYNDMMGKPHRYYPDFYVEMCIDGNPDKFKRMVLEVKPMNETKPPVLPKNANSKKLETFEYQIKTYTKNVYKWERAKEYCKARDLEFYIITEKHLNRIKE